MIDLPRSQLTVVAKVATRTPKVATPSIRGRRVTIAGSARSGYRCLVEKNRLSAADAQCVEEAFQARPDCSVIAGDKIIALAKLGNLPRVGVDVLAALGDGGAERSDGEIAGEHDEHGALAARRIEQRIEQALDPIACRSEY